MAYAIEREREEEARRRRAMKEAGVTETPAEAEAAVARVDVRIAVYQREIGRVYEEADLGPDGKPTDEAVAPEGAREQVAPAAVERSPAADGLTVAWQVHARRWGRTILTPTPETAPRFAERLVLIDRGKRGGMLRAYGGADLNDRRETVNGVAVRLVRCRSLTARLGLSLTARLRHSLTARLRHDRYEARLTPAEVQEMRGTRA